MSLLVSLRLRDVETLYRPRHLRRSYLQIRDNTVHGACRLGHGPGETRVESPSRGIAETIALGIVLAFGKHPFGFSGI